MPVSKVRREKRRVAGIRQPRRVRRLVAISAIGTALLLVGHDGAWAQTPTSPRIPLNALPVGKVAGVGTSTLQPQVLGGKFGVVVDGKIVDPNAYTVNGNTATIRQADNAGILQWGSFDIGAGAKVQIIQPGSTSVLLNKVDGGAWQNKTVIDGMMSANGQVYIYNPNGVIFGKTAQVDVNSLVATSLNIDNTRFLNGILSPSTAAIFSTDSTLAAGVRPGAVVVEGEAGQQARISAANGGRILLAAPTVSNNGVLSAPDGQVALAAGGSVFLTSPSDLRMRGLLVEVNNDLLTSRGGKTSTVTNETLGKILVERGNASLVGLAVNQMGQVSATTSVSLNGSIFLRARDDTTKSTVTESPLGRRGGALVLGPGSVTEINPASDDGNTARASAFTPSWVDMTGNSVHLQSGAQVKAPAGVVDVTARLNQTLPVNNGGSSRIYMEPGSSIDVSGTTSTRLAMESNSLSIELRGTELADYPLNRESGIRGSTVSIDVRKGTQVANVQGYLDLVGHTVGELSATGGTVTLRSDGDVVLAKDSNVNVSGGKVGYNAGYVVTSQLKSQGAAFDIGSAKNDRTYDGVETFKPSSEDPAATPPGRFYEAGYTEGRDAGSVRLDATSLVMRGTLSGTATPGERQRYAGIADANKGLTGGDNTRLLPRGGELVIGNPDSNGLISNFESFNVSGRVAFNGTTTAGTATPAFGAVLDTVLKNTVDVDAGMLAAGGVTRVRAYTKGDIVVNPDASVAALSMGNGAELTLLAQNEVRFMTGVTAPGGTVRAESRNAGVTVVKNDAAARDIAFDVAGLWTNDRDGVGGLSNAVVIGGGSVALAAPQIEIGADTRFDVSGGATLGLTGAITAGAAGAINLESRVNNAATPLTASLVLGKDLDFRGYSALLNGKANGGRLTLVGRNVTIGGAVADAFDIGLADLSLFSNGGFSTYDIRANGNLTVTSGTVLAPTTDVWWAGRNTTIAADGRMQDAFGLMSQTFNAPLPLAGAWGTRAGASIHLAATAEQAVGAGALWIQSGATVAAEAGGTVSLTAGRQVTVDGTVRARGGSLGLFLTPQATTDIPYDSSRRVWLGANSFLDASGSDALVWRNGAGIGQGEILAGGNIRIGRLSAGNLGGLSGYIVAQEGARMDVSGIQSNFTVGAVRGEITTSSLASAGGSIELRAREGVLLAGSLAGAGGSRDASGGSLNIVLDRENIVGGDTYPAAARNLVISVAKPDLTGLSANQPITGFDATGRVSTATINGSGFDNVKLKSQDQLSLDFSGSGGKLDLAVRASLTLDAPVLEAVNATSGNTANLTGAHVQVGNTDWRYQASGASASATSGAAVLKVDAGTVDLAGSSTTRGFGNVELKASGDIRLSGQVNVDLGSAPSGTLSAIVPVGAFATTGDITLTSRQAYPTTLSNFTLASESGSVTFTGNINSASAPTPLSAAGTLTVRAANIDQNGVLRAPFGSITLAASESLGFGSGSLTSVAGDAAIPLGRINNGREWLYDYGNGNTVTFNDAGAANSIVLPQKSVLASGRSVNVKSGAVIDASGGGDLYAYEFTPGPGGSADVLARTGAVATTFAVLPGFDGPVAPIDLQYSQDGGLKTGDRVYLSGAPGLAAGYYTLLPAHYALLKGGFAISAANTRDMQASANGTQVDGSLLVAGRRGTLSGMDSRNIAFQVLSGEQVRRRSEITDASGNASLAGAMASLPKDGGRIAFSASTGLSLDGRTLLGAAADGRRGSADISASDITIVADRSQDTGNSLKLVAGELVGLGAESILIGGLRDVRADGTHVAVGAQNVTLDNRSASNTLTGSEIILAARDRVLVKDGSVLTARDESGRKAANLIVDGVITDRRFDTGAKATGSAADGALLRVSGANQVAIVRNDPAKLKGTLEIEAGSTLGGTRYLVDQNGKEVFVDKVNGGFVDAKGEKALGADGKPLSEAKPMVAAVSLNLDATADETNPGNPKSLVTNGTLQVGEGSALNFGASRISFGDAIPASVGGVKFDVARLGGLSGVADLGFTSYTNIDTYGKVSLGSLSVVTDTHGDPLRIGVQVDSQGKVTDPGAVVVRPSIRTLTLRAAGIQAYDGDSVRDVSLIADTVRFERNGTFSNADPAKAPAEVAVGATTGLTVLARNVALGGGAFDVRGLGTVGITAAGEVRADGKAGVLAAERNLTVAAGGFTANGGASGTFSAGAKDGDKLTLTQTGAALATVSQQRTLTTSAGVVAPSGGLAADLPVGEKLVFGAAAAAPSSFGGTLAFEGNRITSDARIQAGAGAVSMTARQGVAVTGGEINVAGGAVAFGSGNAFAPGGRISLDGGSGNVIVAAAATLDLSSTGASAGTLKLKSGESAGAKVELNGVLKGSASAVAGAAVPAQGNILVDAGGLADFGLLNRTLDTAGFSNSRQFRARQGDVLLAAGEQITARDVVVSADNGNLVIGGAIDASGSKGGSIQLYAGQATGSSGRGNVTLNNTARLLANATEAVASAAGSSGDGGRVVIGSGGRGDGAAMAGENTIMIDAGSSAGGVPQRATINVGNAGSGAGANGTVTLRAQRTTGGGSGVAISGASELSVAGSRETVVEAFRVYESTRISADADAGTTNLNATASGKLLGDATAFMAANSAALPADFKLRAGVEVRSPGDLLVSVNETGAADQRGWNLQPWRPGGEPVALTLRAGGGLQVLGSISDGFVASAGGSSMPGWQLDPSGSASASYRIVGGADLAAANPLDVVRSGTAGNGVRLGFARTNAVSTDLPVALIRSGTGRIDIAAGGDVTFDTLSAGTASALGATVYTAGRATAIESGFVAPGNQTINPVYGGGGSTTAQFSADGGSISVNAGGNVIGSATPNLVNNWLFRRGRTATDATGTTAFGTSGRNNTGERLQTAWWSRFDYFNQGVATLGGGDVAVNAGGNIADLSVSAASNGQVTADASRRPVSLFERGGGDIRVNAVGDILGGTFYVQKGDAAINAGGSIAAGSRSIVDPQLERSVALRPVLALGDGAISLTAGKDVQIEGVINPTMTRQSVNNAAALVSATLPNHYGYFSTYSPTSSVKLTALSGNAVLGNNAEALSRAGGSVLRDGLDSAQGVEKSYVATYQLYPGSLSVAALGGDVSFQAGFSMSPAPNGQLELLAGGSVKSDFQRSTKDVLPASTRQPIVMLDRDPARMPGPLTPVTLTADDFNILRGTGIEGLAYHTNGGLHKDDAQPVRIVALTGDITGENYFNNLQGAFETLSLPKKAEIIAGRDIRDLGFKIQNLAPTDVTVVSAGRDLVDSTKQTEKTAVVGHVVTGPGTADIRAGRNIDLGIGPGVITRGSILNGYLPDGGASLVVTAGAKADYARFVQQQVALTRAEFPAADQDALIAYVRKVDPGLPADLSFEGAVSAFNKIDPGGARNTPEKLLAYQTAFYEGRRSEFEARKPLFNQIYFDKLARAAGAVGGGSLDLAKFDRVIASLFPGTSAGGGDINVFGSQFRTEQGGSIDLFAPAGSVNAGLVDVPAAVKAKADSTLGIFTIRGGAIGAQVKENFLVNQARVFTLGGGDITLASQFGNIDAGRGAKTAVSAPPPLLKTDKDGNTVVEIAGSISGSGIATLKTSDSVPASNVYPIAPRGIFDAGDAGLRSSGTVNIVASQVVNAGNIAASGGVSGAKTADTGGLGGAAAAPPPPPATKADSFASAINPNPDAAASLTVELLGFGGSSGSTSNNVAAPGSSPSTTKPSEKPGSSDQPAQ